LTRALRPLIGEHSRHPSSLGPRAWEHGSYLLLEDGFGFGFYETDEENPLYNGYLSLPLEIIWTAPEVDPPEDDEPAMKYILDTINDVNDTCAPIQLTANSLTLMCGT
jgi:hypothetical protein